MAGSAIPRSAAHTFATRAFVVLFLAIMALPGLGLALGLERNTVSESEMRELAVWPKWSWRAADVAAWPGLFEAYFNDHFLLRTRLIDWRSSVLWTGLHSASSDTVIAGKHDWLFYAADGGIDDWTQVEPFTTPELAIWRETLVRRRDYLTKRGIRFLFVIAPDKQMVYPEFMPDGLRRLRQDYRSDQLLAYLRDTHTDIPILDLREALVAAKPSGLLYHRYDTHWNDRGGLVGYRAIIAALQQWFPLGTPLELADFDTSPGVSSGDRTPMLGLTDPGRALLPGLTLRRGYGYRTTEPQWPNPYGEDALRITEHRDHSLPTLMMFRDSFAARLMPYLSEHFSRASYYWQNEFDFDAIDSEHPDVVVQEFVARHFVTWVPYPGIIPK